MAYRDILAEVSLQMENLKLSSPLRTEQNGNENKENTLGDQDIPKIKSVEPSVCSTTLPIFLTRDETSSTQLNGTKIISINLTEFESPSSSHELRKSLNLSDVDNSLCSAGNSEENHAEITCRNGSLNETITNSTIEFNHHLNGDSPECGNCTFLCGKINSEDTVNYISDNNAGVNVIVENLENCGKQENLNSTFAAGDNEYVQDTCDNEDYVNTKVEAELPNFDKVEFTSCEGISYDLNLINKVDEKPDIDKHSESTLYVASAGENKLSLSNESGQTHASLDSQKLDSVLASDLKLSSSLRTEQYGDENKENTLGDQDIPEIKSVEPSSCITTSPIFRTRDETSTQLKGPCESSSSSSHELTKSLNLSEVDSLYSTGNSEENHEEFTCRNGSITNSTIELNHLNGDSPECGNCTFVCGKINSEDNLNSTSDINAGVNVIVENLGNSEKQENLNSTFAVVENEYVQDTCGNEDFVNTKVEAELPNFEKVEFTSCEDISYDLNLIHKFDEKPGIDKHSESTLYVATAEENKLSSSNESGQTQASLDSQKLDSVLASDMEEINETFHQDISDLKLELNATQQAKATLELEIGKKDEIILKTQAEAIKKEHQLQQDIKSLKEQLKEKSSCSEKDSIKDLEEALKESKAKESHAVSELNANYREIMEGYDKTIAACIAHSQKLKEENDTVTRHLANLELSFSDLHQKYERTKTIIDGFKSNEEKLKKAFVIFEETGHKQEEKYESLKAHAKAQIEKSHKEIIKYKEKYDAEVNKRDAIIKRLEIKNTALENSLDQKSQECVALAALFDEVTGKKI